MLSGQQSRSLAQIFDSDAVLVSESDRTHYGQDWSRFISPDPAAVVFPKEVSQLKALIALARSSQIGLVPSGGRTGLSGGATAANGEIVVSFERMNRVLDFDADSRMVKVEPGVITQHLQQFAIDQNLYYPVDFASSGSSHVGGNIATNAGGIKVLRYGLTREWVAGLEVVTGNGDYLSLNQGLVKNATGIDQRHLFVGSEGILGFTSSAWMRLTEAPQPLRVMLLAVPSMRIALSVLSICQSHLNLTAFEFFSQEALMHVREHLSLSSPLSDAPFYVLCEFEQHKGGEAGLSDAMDVYTKLSEKSWVSDGVIAQSERENQSLWRYREGISEAITSRTPYKHDLAVRISQAPEFLEAVEAAIQSAALPFEIVWFGHIGDGNVHLNILRPEDWSVARFMKACQPLGLQIMQVVARFDGSVSAEHGVGLLKKDYLPFSKSDSERAMMRRIKQVYDTDGVMNPGKILD